MEPPQETEQEGNALVDAAMETFAEELLMSGGAFGELLDVDQMGYDDLLLLGRYALLAWGLCVCVRVCLGVGAFDGPMYVCIV